MDSLNYKIELAVIIAYMLTLLGIGVAFKSFNANISDFFRGGGRGTWWLVGASAFMSSVSAYTFTGAAGVAFEAGWSVAVIYIANALGFLLAFICFAPWFRQLRAITSPQVIEMRYNASTQQLYAVSNIVVSILNGGLQLWALAIFTSTIFGLNVSLVIVAIGLVVIFYSTTGGSWAVMATDFVQSIIMVPLTIIIAVICLAHLGGISEMFDRIEASGLKDPFSMINSPDAFPSGQFSIWWVVAILVTQALLSNTMVSGQRYFAVKNGKDARKAALLAFVLMTLGSIFWFIPPITARLLFEPEVLSMGAGLNKPSEAAYAVTSLMLLPSGMAGLVVVAMFSATMSSLDSGINRNAGIFVKDIYPFICRHMRITVRSEESLLRLSRIFSLVFGAIIISTALYFAELGGRGMFEVMLTVIAMLGIPLAVPMILGLFIKKVPEYSAIIAVVFGLAPSILALILGLSWNFQTQVFANLSFGVIGFLSTVALWKRTRTEYRRKVEHFFELMHRPVDFEKEIGGANDVRQLVLIGNFTALVGIFICLLLLVPNPPGGRLALLILSLSVFAIGFAMRICGRK